MNRATNVLLVIHSIAEKIITVVLLLVLVVVVVWATAEWSLQLIGMFWERLATGTEFDEQALVDFVSRLGILHDVFGGFLLILIGVELMKTIAMYLRSHELHVEVVFTVAIIAIARHAIELDIRSVDAMQLLGLGGLVIALSAGYFFYRRSLALAARDGAAIRNAEDET